MQYPKIVELVHETMQSFPLPNPYPRDNKDWITSILYRFQQNPKKYPGKGVARDCIDFAAKDIPIEQWGITKEHYAHAKSAQHNKWLEWRESLSPIDR